MFQPRWRDERKLTVCWSASEQTSSRRSGFFYRRNLCPPLPTLHSPPSAPLPLIFHQSHPHNHDTPWKLISRIAISQFLPRWILNVIYKFNSPLCIQGHFCLFFNMCTVYLRAVTDAALGTVFHGRQACVYNSYCIGEHCVRLPLSEVCR